MQRKSHSWDGVLRMDKTIQTCRVSSVHSQDYITSVIGGDFILKKNRWKRRKKMLLHLSYGFIGILFSCLINKWEENSVTFKAAQCASQQEFALIVYKQPFQQANMTDGYYDKRYTTRILTRWVIQILHKITRIQRILSLHCTHSQRVESITPTINILQKNYASSYISIRNHRIPSKIYHLSENLTSLYVGERRVTRRHFRFDFSFCTTVSIHHLRIFSKKFKWRCTGRIYN